MNLAVNPFIWLDFQNVKSWIILDSSFIAALYAVEEIQHNKKIWLLKWPLNFLKLFGNISYYFTCLGIKYKKVNKISLHAF